MALTAIHLGEHRAEELEALGMSAAELARKISVPNNRITQILNGTRAITGDAALGLAHFFGTSAQFWLNLQSLYELRLGQGKVAGAFTGNAFGPSSATSVVLRHDTFINASCLPSRVADVSVGLTPVQFVSRTGSPSAPRTTHAQRPQVVAASLILFRS